MGIKSTSGNARGHIGITGFPIPYYPSSLIRYGIQKDRWLDQPPTYPDRVYLFSLLV
jgi:hypothetical protein